MARCFNASLKNGPISNRKMGLRRSGRLASAGRSEKVRRLAGIPEAVAFVPAIYLVALCEPCRSAGIARNS